MIEHSLDPTFINSVANHPEVRPWLGPDVHGAYDSKLDVEPLMRSGQAFALVAPGAGGFFVQRLDPREQEYECHTMFLPEHRGAIAFQAACEALDWLFANTYCQRLYTQLPDGNAPARLLARRVGFEIIPQRTSAWRLAGGAGDDAMITREGWSERRAKLEALTMRECLSPQPHQPS